MCLALFPECCILLGSSGSVGFVLFVCLFKLSFSDAFRAVWVEAVSIVQFIQKSTWVWLLVIVSKQWDLEYAYWDKVLKTLFSVYNNDWMLHEWSAFSCQTLWRVGFFIMWEQFITTVKYFDLAKVISWSVNLKLIDFQLEIVLLRTTILFKVINVFTGMFCLFSVTDESRIFFSLFCTCPKQASLCLRSVAQKRDEKYFLVYDDKWGIK